jgi:hypothetical protein
MLALCRERAEAEGLSPNLYVQAMHELRLLRTYKTVVLCGGFGLVGIATRASKACDASMTTSNPVVFCCSTARFHMPSPAGEEHVLRMSMYFTHELVTLLELAGFTDVILRGDYSDEEPSAETDFGGLVPSVCVHSR